MFGYQVATFLEELIKRTEDRPILAHFHEWYVLCNTFNFYSVHEVRSALKMQPIRCEYPYYINSYIQVGRRWFDRFKETSIAGRDFVHHSRYFVGTVSYNVLYFIVLDYERYSVIAGSIILHQERDIFAHLKHWHDGQRARLTSLLQIHGRWSRRSLQPHSTH